MIRDLKTLLAGQRRTDVRYAPRGRMIQPGRSANRAGAGPRQFKVVSNAWDVLVCHAFDGDVEGSEAVSVAKSADVRWGNSTGAPFERDGITYTQTTADARSATNGTTTNNEMIVPKYIAGDLIMGVRCRIKVNGTWYDWVEQSGREWAHVP